MRSFNANFITEKNKRATGPAPVNLIKFNFDTPIYLSDRDVTPSGGSAHSGLIKSWGFIDTSIRQTSGQNILGTITIPDLSLTIINSESPRFSDSFSDNDPPENVLVELDQWFEGLTYAEREPIFKGYVLSPIIYDLYTCTLTIRSIWQKYNKKIGEDEILNQDDYPNIDPDHVGKMGNILYGEHWAVPCRPVVAGAVDYLKDDITSSQTTIELSDAGEFPPGGATIGIDNEKITYTGISTNTLTGCTRGADGTDAVAHLGDRSVWEELTTFVYLIASHPVKTIGDVFVKRDQSYRRGFKITSVVTTYTGQTGDELAGYEGLAVLTVPAKLTKQQAIDLLIDDGMDVDDAIAVVDTIDVSDTIAVIDGITVSDTIGVSDTIDVDDGIGVSDTIDVDDGIGVTDDIDFTSPTTTRQAYPTSASGTADDPGNAKDGNPDTYSEIYPGEYLDLNFHLADSGEPYKVYVWIKAKKATSNVADLRVTADFNKGPTPAYVNLDVGSEPGDYRALFTCASGTDWYLDIRLTDDNGQDTYYIYEVWMEVRYTPALSKSGSASKTGSATKEGSASKTGSATKEGSASKTGAASKNGTASKDGTASKEGAASKSGTVTRTGTITLIGNSISDVSIGDDIVCAVDGYQDDGSGTYTGTPNALIERPDHVFKHLWCEILGAPSGDIDTTSFAAAGTYYSTNNYIFSLAIQNTIQASDLFMRLAIQCRSWLIVTAYGELKLLVRSLSQSSGHAIAKNEVKSDSVSVSRSSTEDLINSFHLYYDKDRCILGNVTDAYMKSKKFEDNISITTYGKHQWNGDETILCFDAVTSEAMVTHVGNFLLDFHKVIRRMPRFGVFLNNLEIEPGDIIDITHDLDSMAGYICEVLKCVHHIGNKSTVDYQEVIAISN